MVALEITAQKEGDRRRQRKRTSDRARAWDLRTLFCGASATSYWSQLQILRLPSPFVPVAGVPLYSDRLGPMPQSWYCVM